MVSRLLLTVAGSVIVFDLLKGTFVKQIPFQAKLFGPESFSKEPLSHAVKNLQANASHHLMISYDDRSFVVLNQASKQVAAY